MKLLVTSGWFLLLLPFASADTPPAQEKPAHPLVERATLQKRLERSSPDAREGSLCSVALSRDGKTLAAGGQRWGDGKGIVVSVLVSKKQELTPLIPGRWRWLPDCTQPRRCRGHRRCS